ncbi:MAG: MFS transporter, partial [Pseudomonadota bacterium]
MAALAVGQIVVWSGMFYGFSALLPRWEAAFAQTPGPAPALGLSLALAVAAMCAPAAGRAVDRGLGPWLMPAGALAGAAGLALLSQAQSLWAFHAVWAAMGAAMACCLYEPCFALLTRARGADARRAIAALTLIAGFATLVCFPTVAALESALGWRGAMRVMAVG